MESIELNGVRLSYRDSGCGERGRPCLLFVHGAGASLEQFSAQYDFFSPRYRVVLVSLRGHGTSSAPAETEREAYALSAMAEDAAVLIESLGLAPVHYVGCSMGGVLGLELASKRPELLASLTIFGSVARIALPDLIRKLIFGFDSYLVRGDAGRKLRSLARYVSAKAEVREAIAAMFLQARDAIQIGRASCRERV